MDSIIKKIHFKFLLSIFLNLVIMICFLAFFPTNYEMADDFSYSQFITDGCYGFNFMNYLISALLGFIQNLIYPLNAYSLSFIFFSFCAFTAITRVFLDKFNLLISVCITIFINGFFAINHYGTISFTRLPTLLVITGILCIIHYANREKWKLGVFIGALFVILGSTFRFKIFEVALVVAVFYVLGKSISEYFSIEKHSRKFSNLFKIFFNTKRLVIVIITVGICFSLNITSSLIIKSDPELSYFTEYTKARSDVWDFPVPEYTECKNEYNLINIDENDLTMLKSGYMDDEGAFSLEQLKNIKEISNNYTDTKISYIDIFIDMIISEIANIRAIGDKGIASFAFLLVLFLYLIIMKKRNYFIPFCLMLITLIFYYYLWLIDRTPFRVVYEFWFSSVVYLFYSFSFDESKTFVKKIYSKRKKIVLVFTLISSIFISLIGTYLSNCANGYLFYAYTFTDNQLLLKNYISEHSTKKFELARNCDLIHEGEDIFHVVKSSPDKNYQNYVCTYYALPHYKDSVKNFGTDNMYSYLLEDDVYFVVNLDNSHAEIMQKYLQKYYSNGNVIVTDLVDTVGTYGIYKYTIN